MIIPGTSRKRIEVDPNTDFLIPLELAELVTLDFETHEMVFRMNQSRLQTYMGCHRAFYWKYVIDLDTGRPVLRLELGSGVHEGLATKDAGASIEEAVEQAKKRFAVEYKDIAFLPGELEEFNEALGTIERILPAYYEHWEAERQPFTPLGLEIGGKVVVGYVTIGEVRWTIIIQFRLDKLVTFNNQIWIVDHKTAAKLDLRDVAKYAMDVQFTAYAWAATKLLQEQTPAGFNFEPRVQGVIVDMLVKTKVPQFHRDLFPRTDAELVEFQYDWLGWCEQIIRMAIRANEFEANGVPPKFAFPKNTRYCFWYGTCPYYELCLHDTPVTRSNYVRRHPDYVDAPLEMKDGKPEVDA